MARTITLTGPEGVWDVITVNDQDGTMYDDAGDEVTMGMLPTIIQEFINGEYEDGRVL